MLHHQGACWPMFPERMQGGLFYNFNAIAHGPVCTWPCCMPCCGVLCHAMPRCAMPCEIWPTSDPWIAGVSTCVPVHGAAATTLHRCPCVITCPQVPPLRVRPSDIRAMQASGADLAARG